VIAIPGSQFLRIMHFEEDPAYIAYPSPKAIPNASRQAHLAIKKRRKHMPNNLKHCAVHADDVNRARAFYEKVLGVEVHALETAKFLSY